MYPYQAYQPQQPYPQPRYQPPSTTSGNVLFVNGLDGAKAYPMQPNSNMILVDSSEPYVYLKSTDAANFPTIERFRIKNDPIANMQEPLPGDIYATKEDLGVLSSKIDALIAAMDTMKGVRHAEPDIQQSSAATSDFEPHHEPDGPDKGGYERGYQGYIRPDAG